MRKQNQEYLVSFAAATGAALLATLTRWALSPLVGSAAPFMTYFVATLALAWFQGFLAAAIGVAWGVVVGSWLFVRDDTPGVVLATRTRLATIIAFAFLALATSLLLHLLRRALERSRLAENAEREQRLWFEATLSSIGDAVITTGPNARILHANPVAQALLGWTENEMLGRPLTDVFRTRDLSRTSGVPNHSILITRSDVEIPINHRAAPIIGPRGKTAGEVIVFRDVSAQVRAAEELRNANAALQSSNQRLARLNEDLERFAFVASHDLQEPLRMITVYSQLLARKLPTEPSGELHGFVEHIVGGAKRMRELVGDLLAYAQIGARSERTTSTTDLNVALQIATQNLKAAIDESGASITAPLLPILDVSEGHFVALFQNLIGNAIKYRTGPAPEVHISVEEENGHFRFAVADNGIGIEPEYLEKIFVPFKRLHGADIPGTGIGLAICQRVVERYGGRIWAESKPGDGSTFVFTLPREAAQKAASHG